MLAQKDPGVAFALISADNSNSHTAKSSLSFVRSDSGLGTLLGENSRSTILPTT